MIPINIAITDVLQHPKVISEGFPPENSSEALLKEILFDLGVDTNFSFECHDGLVRDSDNKLHSGCYWSGVERTDKEWRDSGMASDEVIDMFRSNIAKTVKQKDIGEYIHGKR